MKEPPETYGTSSAIAAADVSERVDDQAFARAGSLVLRRANPPLGQLTVAKATLPSDVALTTDTRAAPSGMVMRWIAVHHPLRFLPRTLPAACLLIGLFGPVPADAQIRGMPVHFSPSAQPGIRLHGDFAGGDDPFETYFGGRATINLALVTIAGGVGSLDDEVGWGGTISANILRGAARNFSLSLDGGFGVNDIDGRTTHEIPLGLGIAYEATMTGVDLEPWIGLRAHIRRTSVEELADQPYSTQVGPGISAGVNARSAFIHNFGFHVAVDYLTITQPFGEGRDKTLLFNVGLNYLIPLSGLPAHGIIGASCSPFDPC